MEAVLRQIAPPHGGFGKGGPKKEVVNRFFLSYYLSRALSCIDCRRGSGTVCQVTIMSPKGRSDGVKPTIDVYHGNLPGNKNIGNSHTIATHTLRSPYLHPFLHAYFVFRHLHKDQVDFDQPRKNSECRFSH